MRQSNGRQRGIDSSKVRLEKEKRRKKQGLATEQEKDAHNMSKGMM